MSKRERRHGFIIFFGWRTITTGDRRPPVDMVCPACHEETRIRGRVRRRWFTLFFLPVLPLDPVTDELRFSQCVGCKATFDRPLEQMARHAAAYAGNDHASAIALYNHLREHPSDSATLVRLIDLYVTMNELPEAEAACRHFPAAFQSDPACAAALDRARAT